MKAELNMKLKSKKFVKRETEAEPKPQNELFEIRGTDMVTLPRGKRRVVFFFLIFTFIVLSRTPLIIRTVFFPPRECSPGPP